MEAGADVRAKAGEGLEPLHSVALNQNAEAAAAAVHALVAAGADVRANDNLGLVPLHGAARNPNAEAAAAVTKALVAAGANVRAKDNDGQEPLHLAAVNKNAGAASAAVQALLEAGFGCAGKGQEWPGSATCCSFQHMCRGSSSGHSSPGGRRRRPECFGSRWAPPAALHSRPPAHSAAAGAPGRLPFAARQRRQDDDGGCS